MKPASQINKLYESISLSRLYGIDGRENGIHPTATRTLIFNKYLVTKIIILILVSICLNLIRIEPAAAKSILGTGLGKWRLKEIYKTNNIWGIDAQQADGLLNSVVQIGRDNITSCNQTADIKDIRYSVINNRQLFIGNHVSFSEIGISRRLVTEVDISSSSVNCFQTHSMPGLNYYIIGKRRILIEFMGVFYRTLPVNVRAARTRTSLSEK